VRRGGGQGLEVGLARWVGGGGGGVEASACVSGVLSFDRFMSGWRWILW